MKTPLLFLCHRIPYPPNKGDKIRSFHVLKFLAERYRIFLAAFIDDPVDWAQKEKLHAWCEESFFQGLNPTWARVRSLSGFITGKPLTLPYYHDPNMASWIDHTMEREKIRHVLVYSSAMAQYTIGPRFDGTKRVIDFVDVDSDKWRQYAAKKQWPISWIYKWEARQLLAFERSMAEMFDTSSFVSKEEAALFCKLAPESAEKVNYFANGVDLENFNPDREYTNPYPEGGRQIAFTGAMDYWPNEDAVTWFAEEVLPELRNKWPGTAFYIVGSRPTDKVLKLGSLPGVTVTGSVPDVRPYVAHATVIVAPMRIARGIQNKVLEAMSMAKSVVVTSMGLEGINASNGRELLVADTVSEFVDSISKLFSGEMKGIGDRARQKVCMEFSWNATLPKLGQWLE